MPERPLHSDVIFKKWKAFTDLHFTNWLIHSFIHSIGMCRMRWFLAVLRSFFHSSLLCTFSCHPSPPTILPSSITSSCYLFLGLPLNLVVPKFIYNTLLGILFSSILCTCSNQHNLFNLTVSSWTKRDQLDVTCFIISLFNVQHVLDVNISILRSLWLICWVISISWGWMY